VANPVSDNQLLGIRGTKQRTKARSLLRAILRTYRFLSHLAPSFNSTRPPDASRS
jgi:hypothetical protein